MLTLSTAVLISDLDTTAQGQKVKYTIGVKVHS